MFSSIDKIIVCLKNNVFDLFLDFIVRLTLDALRHFRKKKAIPQKRRINIQIVSAVTEFLVLYFYKFENPPLTKILLLVMVYANNSLSKR